MRNPSRPVVIAALLSLASGAFAQEVSTEGVVRDQYLGNWYGIITQESGPTIRYFDMELSVAQRDDVDSLYSVSAHVMDGDYHAYMVGEAFRDPDGELFVTEREIVRADSIPNMEWCLKRLLLRRSMEDGELHLRGAWAGDASFGPCEPGKMDLVRQVMRP